MNVLILDTSTAYCSITLYTKGGKFFNQKKYAPRKHNEYILYMIDELIKQAQIRKGDIQLLAYGVGPGSFVGVRLSAAVTYAMALTLNCPVIGFSSMQSIATTAYHRTNIPNVGVIINAHMADVYYGKYQWIKEKNIMELQKEICLKITDCNAQVFDKESIIVGDLVDGINSKLHLTDCYPDTQLMLPTIIHHHMNGANREKNNVAQPIYLQGTSQWDM